MIKLAHNKLASHTQAELKDNGLSERQIQMYALKNIKSVDAAYELKDVFNNQEALQVLGHAQHDLQMKICDATIAYAEWQAYKHLFDFDVD